MEHEDTEDEGFNPLWAAAAAVLALVIMLVAVNYLNGQGGDTPPAAAQTTEAEGAPLPTPEEDEAECPSSWILSQGDHENNRWFSAGLEEINNATTPEEAREATNTWLSQVRRSPNLLSGAAAYFLDGRQVDPSTLMDENGKCATAAAVALTAEIELAIADSGITPEEAPSNGRNSGVNDEGQVVSSEHEGITGDRRAVKVVMKDGTTIWILGRCGNPVVEGPAPVPPGPTDEPPPAPPAEQVTTTTTTVPDDGKDHRQSPVSDDSNDPCEACRPNELDSDGNIRPSSDGGRPTPATTVPSRPPGGNDGGSHGDSGEGAVTTVPTQTTVAPAPAPPTTVSPAPPAPDCVDPHGVGLCED